ncbi:MAG: hypothetical protein H6728_05365 [Myxococcales bacterium]|nr:hypothetical protein [Myxococcales bacterium]
MVEHYPQTPAILFLSYDATLAQQVESFAATHQIPVLYASSFTEGREIASQYPLRCMILDVMREEESGFHFAEWVRQQAPLDLVDLIFVSDTHPAAHFREAALPRYRAIAYLDLPVSYEELYQVLALQLQRSSRSANMPPRTPAPSSFERVHRASLHPPQASAASSSWTGVPESSWQAAFSSDALASASHVPSQSGLAGSSHSAASSWPSASSSWPTPGAADLNPTQFLTDPNEWAQSVLSRSQDPEHLRPDLEEDDLADTGNYGEAPDFDEISAESTAEELPCVSRDLHATTSAISSQEFVPPSLGIDPQPAILAEPAASSPSLVMQGVSSQHAEDAVSWFADEATNAPYKEKIPEAPRVFGEDDEPPSPEAESSFEEGFTWLAQRDYGRALQSFARAFQLQSSPRYECYFAWALFLSQPHNQLQAKIALMHLEKSRKIDPYYEKTYLFMGHIFLQLRRFEDAQRLYREALVIEPKFLEVYRELRLLELQMTRSFRS